jgi:hypothetical protein
VDRLRRQRNGSIAVPINSCRVPFSNFAEAERVKKWTQNIPALAETARYPIHFSMKAEARLRENNNGNMMKLFLGNRRKNGGHQSHNWANLAQKKSRY